MNYLAHALLAGPDDDYRLGGLLGDFVKGPLPPASQHLAVGVAEFSAGVIAGLLLHRRIDSFADGHQAFDRSRRRVSAARRRYSGVIVDLFYDHFLAVHWERFSTQALESFSAAVYALLARQPLPDRLARILPTMRQEDWLASYRQPAAVSRALDQIATHRISRSNALGGAGSELAEHYGQFESDFLEFFPAVQAFADDFRRQRRP